MSEGKWLGPECAKLKAPGEYRFGDKCVCKHTAKSADENRNSASVAIHIPANDGRQMQLQKAQSDDKIQFRVRLRHLATKYVLKKANLGPPLGVTQTGSETLRNPNAPTFGERSIEWTLRMEEKAERPVWTVHKNVYTFPGSYSEIDIGSSNRVPRAMFLHLPCGLRVVTSCGE